MARYFAEHDFLVQPNGTPRLVTRDKIASVLVNPGTTPNTVVEECLEWMAREWNKDAPFDVTWYTGGSLVAATLQRFRDKYPTYLSAAEIFLLPGKVDPGLESVMSTEAVEFLRDYLTQHFHLTSLLLSAWTFDIRRGRVFFHFPGEFELQRASALLPAHTKVLFLDASKLRPEGKCAYTLRDLFATCSRVSIYITADSFLEQHENDFARLATELSFEPFKCDDAPLRKSLSLCAIREDGTVATKRMFHGDGPDSV